MDKSSELFFLQLWESHAEVLLRYAKRKLDNQSLELEVVQDTFLLAVVKMDVLREHPNPGGWLMNTLKFMIARAVEEEARQVALILKMPTAAPSPDFGLTELLPSKLPVKYVQVLTLHYGCGYPLKLICEKLGISLARCKMDLFYARRAVRKALQDTDREGDGLK